MPETALPAIFLHGLFGKTTDWRGCQEHFMGRWAIYSPPLPLDSPECRSFDFLARHIVTFMDRENFSRAVIGGNSIGGHIALEVALRCPRRIAALILTGSSGLFERGFQRKIPHHPGKDWIREKAREVFYNKAYVTDALIDELEAELADRRRRYACARLAGLARRSNLGDLLHRVKAPTLLIWGANDTITPPSVAREFHLRLPNSELQFIDHCGHAPALERPDEFNRILENFVSRHFVTAEC
jgi:2-hydroxy-6-oxonona-2,4-dienedioate hydrolase